MSKADLDESSEQYFSSLYLFQEYRFSKIQLSHHHHQSLLSSSSSFCFVVLFIFTLMLTGNFLFTKSESRTRTHFVKVSPLFAHIAECAVS